MNSFFFLRVDHSGTIWTYVVPVWTLFGPVFIPCGLVAHSYLISGPVSDYCGTVAHLWLIVGSSGPLVNFWFDYCWTVLDSWIILSLGFQLEFFVSLLCSEGLEWVPS